MSLTATSSSEAPVPHLLYQNLCYETIESEYQASSARAARHRVNLNTVHFFWSEQRPIAMYGTSVVELAPSMEQDAVIQLSLADGADCAIVAVNWLMDQCQTLASIGDFRPLVVEWHKKRWQFPVVLFTQFLRVEAAGGNATVATAYNNNNNNNRIMEERIDIGEERPDHKWSRYAGLIAAGVNILALLTIGYSVWKVKNSVNMLVQDDKSQTDAKGSVILKINEWFTRPTGVTTLSTSRY